MKVTIFGNDNLLGASKDFGEENIEKITNVNSNNVDFEYNKPFDFEPSSSYDPDSGGYKDNDRFYLHLETDLRNTLKGVYYSLKLDDNRTSSKHALYPKWIDPDTKMSFGLNITPPPGHKVTELRIFVLPINSDWQKDPLWNDPTKNNNFYIYFNDDWQKIFNEQFRPKPKEVPLKLTLTNCISDYTKNTIQSTRNCTFVEEFEKPDTTNKTGYYFNWSGVPTDIKFTANDGYEFSTTYQVYDDVVFIEKNPKDLKEFTETFESHYDKYDINISAVKIVESLSSFTRIYRINKAKLNSISSDRFMDTKTADILDYSKYIMSLYNLPLSIKDTDVNTDSDIYLGAVKISTKADQIKNDILTYDLGKIKVYEIYHGALDYENTQCYLTVPFIDTITLDPQNVINNTLDLSIDVNLYNGSCVLYVKSENLGKIIHTEKAIISQNIPYYLTNSDVSINDNVNQIIKNTLQPYIIVERDQNKKGLILNYKGFQTFSNIELKTNASYSEQQEIETKLQSGVFIND